jgi:glycosyltransferase involved in cell wall biosynthesis
MNPAPQSRRIMFLYWGRRGAMPQFTLQLARAALTIPGLSPTICISRQNALFPQYADLGKALLSLDTFATNLGALTQAWRLPAIRKRLAAHITQHKIEAVIDLMPHIWSPYIVSTVKTAGARYIAVAHDAGHHPGDTTHRVKNLIDRCLIRADRVITLSQSVANQLAALGKIPPASIVPLFLPDLDFGTAQMLPAPRPGEPIRLMFLGRIMPYKGLGLLLDALDIVRAEGHPIHLGVFGEGPLGDDHQRLTAMNADVINRWLTEAEISQLLPRYHAAILSHTEASQSGVAAVAFGAGLPVIATPVGGLVEQVQDGITGLLATAPTAPAVAAAITRLATNPTLYANLRANIAARHNFRSMPRFVEACVAAALSTNANVSP